MCRRKPAFLCMDEEEYEKYLDQIDNLDALINGRAEEPTYIQDQLRDQDGIRVPGCYRTVPAPTE